MFENVVTICVPHSVYSTHGVPFGFVGVGGGLGKNAMPENLTLCQVVLN